MDGRRSTIFHVFRKQHKLEMQRASSGAVCGRGCVRHRVILTVLAKHRAVMGVLWSNERPVYGCVSFFFL